MRDAFVFPLDGWAPPPLARPLRSRAMATEHPKR